MTTSPLRPPPSHPQAHARGFTLVELMIVVVIVGILAMLAVYGVRKYIANSKTTEARNSLGAIAQDAALAYERESTSSFVPGPGVQAGVVRHLCATGTTSYVPSTLAAVSAAKYQSSATDWANTTDVAARTGFPCLRFSMSQPQYYRYGYSSAGAGTAGASYSATANGDLNGDLVPSTFSITGSINASLILNTAPSISETSPEQ